MYIEWHCSISKTITKVVNVCQVNKIPLQSKNKIQNKHLHWRNYCYQDETPVCTCSNWIRVNCMKDINKITTKFYRTSFLKRKQQTKKNYRNVIKVYTKREHKTTNTHTKRWTKKKKKTSATLLKPKHISLCEIIVNFAYAPINASVYMKRTENTNTMAVKNKQQSEFRYRFTILNFIFISFVSSILIGE